MRVSPRLRRTTGAYHCDRDGIHCAYAAIMLTATADGIARIVVFGDPGTFARSGLPPTRLATFPVPVIHRLRAAGW